MTYPLLRGTRVVESSAFIAAPMCGLTLAQYGADVIRIDLVGGGIDYRRMPLANGGRSIYWTSLNRDKRSVALDIRRPEGRELLKALVTAPGDNGGILLTNIPVAWLSYAELSSARADVITCVIEGSSDGANAVDYTINCATGLPSITGGGSKERPVNHVLPAWDVITAMHAALGLVTALSERRRIGIGAELKVALSDTAFSTLSSIGMLAEAQLIDEDRPSIGNDIYGAFGRDFRTRDGERIMVAAISSRQWSSLVAACGIASAISAIEGATGQDFSREDDRFAGRDLIAALLKPWFAARTASEAGCAFDTAGVCWGQYRTLRELVRHDERVSLANPIFEELHTSGIGTHLSARQPVRVGGRPHEPARSAPWLGQHTDEVLHEVLGLSRSELSRLHDAHIIAGPEKDPFWKTDAALNAAVH